MQVLISTVELERLQGLADIKKEMLEALAKLASLHPSRDVDLDNLPEWADKIVTLIQSSEKGYVRLVEREQELMHEVDRLKDKLGDLEQELGDTVTRAVDAESRSHLWESKYVEAVTKWDRVHKASTEICANCGGNVCTLEECDDHLYACELTDDRWACSESCYDVLVDRMETVGQNPAQAEERSQPDQPMTELSSSHPLLFCWKKWSDWPLGDTEKQLLDYVIESAYQCGMSNLRNWADVELVRQGHETLSTMTGVLLPGWTNVFEEAHELAQKIPPRTDPPTR